MAATVAATSTVDLQNSHARVLKAPNGKYYVCVVNGVSVRFCSATTLLGTWTVEATVDVSGTVTITSFDYVMLGTMIFLVVTNTSEEIRFSRFDTSDDAIDVTGDVVSTGLSANTFGQNTGGDVQHAAIEVVSPAKCLIVGHGANSREMGVDYARINYYYSINADGAAAANVDWTDGGVIDKSVEDATLEQDQCGCALVRGTGDYIHLVWGNENGVIITLSWHRRIDFSGSSPTLSSRFDTNVSMDSGTFQNYGIFDLVSFWRDGNFHLALLGVDENADPKAMWTTVANSSTTSLADYGNWATGAVHADTVPNTNWPECSIAAHGDTLYAAWADASVDIVYEDDGGTFTWTGSPTLLGSAGTFVGAHATIIDDSGPVLAVVYGNGTGVEIETVSIARTYGNLNTTIFSDQNYNHGPIEI